MEDAVTRLKKIGKPAGILTGNEEEIRRYISWGYTFVAVGSDIGLLGAPPIRWRRSTRAETWVNSVSASRSRARKTPIWSAAPGRYVDDVTVAGQARAHVLRSPHAHARIVVDLAPTPQRRCPACCSS